MRIIFAVLLLFGVLAGCSVNGTENQSGARPTPVAIATSTAIPSPMESTSLPSPCSDSNLYSGRGSVPFSAPWLPYCPFCCENPYPTADTDN